MRIEYDLKGKGHIYQFNILFWKEIHFVRLEMLDRLSIAARENIIARWRVKSIHSKK